MNKKQKLAILLFLIGFAGVLSSMTQYPPLNETHNIFTDFKLLWQLKRLYLIGPTINLLLAVIVGTLLYDKVNFKLPILERLVDWNKKAEAKRNIPSGIAGGIIVGVLIMVIIVVFTPLLPPETIATRGDLKANLLAKILNGGITYEIINRFGLMTFLVWLINKISGKLTPTIYWAGIIGSGIIFGLFNIIPSYMILGMPVASVILYKTLLSAVTAIVFGWLYWKKGLGTAMFAHILAIVIMTIGGYVFNI